MKNTTRLFATSFVFLLSCADLSEKKEHVSLHKKSNTEDPIDNSEINKDETKPDEQFAIEILKENLKIQEINLSDENAPEHIQIFLSKGIEKIQSYSNKNDWKDSLTNYYEHFILFTATFDKQENAEATFERIRSDSQYEISQYVELDKEVFKRVNALNIDSKPGGLITQNGKQIFSLIEQCTPESMEGGWHKYETKLTDYIANKVGFIDVLKAGCGEDRYYGGRRKTEPTNAF